MIVVLSLVSRLIPSEARTAAGKSFMQRKLKSSKLLIDQRYVNIGWEFESYQDWLPKLREEVIKLGSAIGAAKNSMYCPLSMLVEELEEVISVLRRCGVNGDQLTSDWTVTCFNDMQVPRGVLVEAYVRVFESSLNTDKDLYVQADLIFSFLRLLMEWLNASSK